MSIVLSILLLFFIATMSCDYVLCKLSVREPIALGIAIIFGILSAIFLSATNVIAKLG